MTRVPATKLVELRRVRRPSFESRVLRWFFRHGSGRNVHGVLVAGPSKDGDGMLGKIAAALDLLLKYDPRRLDALRRDTDGIFVFLTTGALAEWHAGARLVVLDERYLCDPQTTTAWLASTLVHEGTHARLDHLGFIYRAERRARIEAVCFRRELAFLRRLPDAGDLIEMVKRQLTRDPSYWTDQAFRERLAAELEKLGVPSWLVRTIERAARAHRRLSQRLSRSSWRRKAA